MNSDVRRHFVKYQSFACETTCFLPNGCRFAEVCFCKFSRKVPCPSFRRRPGEATTLDHPNRKARSLRSLFGLAVEDPGQGGFTPRPPPVRYTGREAMQRRLGRLLPSFCAAATTRRDCPEESGMHSLRRRERTRARPRTRRSPDRASRPPSAA